MFSGFDDEAARALVAAMEDNEIGEVPMDTMEQDALPTEQHEAAVEAGEVVTMDTM